MFKKFISLVAIVSAVICVLTVVWLQMNPPVTIHVQRIHDAIDDPDGTNPKYEISTGAMPGMMVEGDDAAPEAGPEMIENPTSSQLYVLADKLSSQRNLAISAEYRIGATRDNVDAIEQTIASQCARSETCSIIPATNSTIQRNMAGTKVYLLMPARDITAWVATLEQATVETRKQDTIIYKMQDRKRPTPRQLSDGLDRLARIQSQIRKIEPLVQGYERDRLQDVKANLAQQFDLLSYAQSSDFALIAIAIDPESMGAPIRVGGNPDAKPFAGLLVLSIIIVVVIGIPLWLAYCMRRWVRRRNDTTAHPNSTESGAPPR